MISTKLLIGIPAVAGIAYLAYRGLALNRLNKELETVTRVNVHKVSLSGIELRVDVILKNPSSGSIRVKYPFVKLHYGNTTLGSSQVKNDDIEVGKFSQVQVPPIFIKMDFLSLATTAPLALKQYRESGKLQLRAETVTTLNNTVPYKKTDLINL